MEFVGYYALHASLNICLLQDFKAMISKASRAIRFFTYGPCATVAVRMGVGEFSKEFLGIFTR